MLVSIVVPNTQRKQWDRARAKTQQRTNHLELRARSHRPGTGRVRKRGQVGNKEKEEEVEEEEEEKKEEDEEEYKEEEKEK